MSKAYPSHGPAPSRSAKCFRLLAFGGSAGGLVPLMQILSALPPDFPIPIAVVQHLGATLRSRLPEVLGFRTRLRCSWAEDGESPRAGCVHVAPPGRNLILTERGTFGTLASVKPHTGWPSVDVFLRSVAQHIGPESIAVILSGALWDGAEGITAVRRRGGATMVQRPACAEHAGMPTAAIDLGRADLSLPLDQITLALSILAERGVE